MFSLRSVMTSFVMVFLCSCITSAKIEKPEPVAVGPLKSWTENVLLWDESTLPSAVFKKRLESLLAVNKIAVDQFDETLKEFVKKTVEGPISLKDLWLEKNPELSFYDTDSLSDKNLSSADQGVFFGQKAILPSDAHIIVMGDLHGSLHSLVRNLWRMQALGYIDQHFKIVKDNTYMVFTGDFVDRGRYSIECIYTVLKLKLANFDRVFLIRGNHETESISKRYGLMTELKLKYGSIEGARLFKDITSFFRFLPVVLFAEFKQEPAIMHFSHGGFSYNATAGQLAHSPAKFLTDENSRYELLGEKQATGYMWSDFHQDDSAQLSNRIEDPSSGAATLGKLAMEQYVLEINKSHKPLKGIFRGHQDQAFGIKMFFKNMPSPEKMIDLARKNQTYPSGPFHWQDVVTDSDKALARSGILFDDYRPVFTFTTAAEGQGVPFDAYGIIKAGKNLADYRLEIHEIPLTERTEERSYLSISKPRGGADSILPSWSELGPGRLLW